MSLSSIPTISLNDYLGSYMTYLRAPIDALKSKKSALEVKLAIFTDLKEKLKDLEDLAEELAGAGTSSSFLSKSVTSSNTSVLTATAGSSAASGAHSIFVTQLARAHTVASRRSEATGSRPIEEDDR